MKKIEILITIILALTLCFLFAYRPAASNYDLTLYLRSGATVPLLRAVERSPFDSLVLFNAFKAALRENNLVKARQCIDRVIWSFDGDLTLWTVLYSKAAIQYQQGDLPGARETLRTSQWLNPKFEPARKLLDEIDKILKSNKGVVLQFSKEGKAK